MNPNVNSLQDNIPTSTAQPMPSVLIANPVPLGGPMHSTPHLRRTNRYNPISASSDRTSIEFTRCLYQAKNIVKELQQFSDSLCPAIKLSPFNGFSASSSLQDPRLSCTDFVGKVNRYLDDTFERFSRLCRVLLMVLRKMERSPHVKRERVASFRTEIFEQVRIAESTRVQIVAYIQQHVDESNRSSSVIAGNAAAGASTVTTPKLSSPSSLTVPTSTANPFYQPHNV